MDDLVSVCGPLERDSDGLVLRIPLDVGGQKLAAVAKGIGSVEDDHLVVRIPDWLAAKLDVTADSLVDVDNADGKFNIRRRQESA